MNIIPIVRAGSHVTRRFSFSKRRMSAAMFITPFSKMRCSSAFMPSAIAVNAVVEPCRRSARTPMLASSGYISHIDEDLCIGCGDCSFYCQFNALEIVNGVNHVIYEKCMGCGVCVNKCTQDAMSLVRDEAKGVSLEIC